MNTFQYIITYLVQFNIYIWYYYLISSVIAACCAHRSGLAFLHIITKTHRLQQQTHLITRKKHHIKFTRRNHLIFTNSRNIHNHHNKNWAYRSLRPILSFFYYVFYFIFYSSYVPIFHPSSFKLNSRHRRRHQWLFSLLLWILEVFISP